MTVHEFAPTDHRLCVCGHPASHHGADPGTRHACREQRVWRREGDLPGVQSGGWHCPCVEFRRAVLKSEAEREVFLALAKVSPRSWEGVHGDGEDEFWSADQVRVAGRTTQGVGIVLGRLAKRGVIEIRRTDVHGLLPDARVSRRAWRRLRQGDVADSQASTTRRCIVRTIWSNWNVGERTFTVGLALGAVAAALHLAAVLA